MALQVIVRHHEIQCIQFLAKVGLGRASCREHLQSARPCIIIKET